MNKNYDKMIDNLLSSVNNEDDCIEFGKKLQECDYKSILNCVSTPNLPAWRLRKWLKEQWDKEST